MRCRALFVTPLVALFLVACGGKSSDTTVAAANDSVVETAVAVTEASTEAVITELEVADTATEATDSAVVETVAAGAPRGPSFSIVAAVSGIWPTPVASETKVSDIDTEAVCTNLRNGGAFGDLDGEYYGGSLSRVEQTLSFQCQFRYAAQAPVSLDGFSDAFVAGMNGPNGESSQGNDGGSVGLVEVTLTGDPFASVESGDQFLGADKGCLAAASAVGLTGAWKSETLASVNGNRVVTCGGPIPSGDTRTADPALTSKAVGSAAPPLD